VLQDSSCARVASGNFYPTTGPVTALDKTNALVKGAAHRVGLASHSFRRHGFEWHVCDGVLALRDGVFLRILAPTVAALQPWLEECAALRRHLNNSESVYVVLFFNHAFSG